VQDISLGLQVWIEFEDFVLCMSCMHMKTSNEAKKMTQRVDSVPHMDRTGGTETGHWTALVEVA
jgi:hypothetical protein